MDSPRLASLTCLVLATTAACGDDLGSTPDLRVVPGDAALKVGGSARFQVVDADGQSVPARLEVDGVGTIDAGGRYLAPRAPATDTISAGELDAVAATVEITGYTGRVAALAASAGKHTGHAAVPLADGSVLFVGSMDDTVIERFVPATRTVEPAGDLGDTRWDLTATPLPGGAVLIAGGRSYLNTYALVVILRDGTLETVGSLTEGRFAHRAVALAGGEVLISGGLPRDGHEVTALATVEVYDPAARGFRATGAMSVARSHHTATRLRDGRVLVVGGRDSTCEVACPQAVWASAELYDPATGQFTPTGSLALARADHTATLLDDGRVVIAGGTTPDLAGTDLASTVEIYDPSTGRFTAGGTMRVSRSEHTATLLGDGRVLLAHGRSDGAGTIATATMEAYDPATFASELTSSPRVTRFRHTATRLDSGEVVLAGGTEGGGGLTAIELYD